MGSPPVELFISQAFSDADDQVKVSQVAPALIPPRWLRSTAVGIPLRFWRVVTRNDPIEEPAKRVLCLSAHAIVMFDGPRGGTGKLPPKRVVLVEDITGITWRQIGEGQDGVRRFLVEGGGSERLK
eukprot:Hpha_TRINITY_DN15717_c2_g3::TRINITY_DN15717_c2_g3_i3::g.36653::m.36653